MNLKEFDAKQFLLEKGERVGLGIAVTLMVLMLVFSLFMPSHGFFSGSPAAKAEPLENGAKTLQAALTNPNAKPGPADSPPTKAERQLIDLDTAPLESQLYETGPWYEPAKPVNPARKPPIIMNILEAAIRVADIPVDTYIFNPTFTKITVLRDPEKRAPAGGGGANNPFNRMKGMMPSGGGSMPMPGRGRGGRSPFGNLHTQGVVGANERPEYDTPLISLDKVSDDEHFARQLRPARMAIIAASFPYKAQLEEFKNKLRLGSIQDVLNEPVDDPKDNKEKLAAFRFLGVEVQRKEFDINGKQLSDWKDLDLKETYKYWLMQSYLPFEQDDPKYAPIKFDRLVWPRLREFHEESQQGQMNMGQPMAAGPQGGRQREEAPRKEGESKYPDVAGELPSIQKTLASLVEVQPQQMAVRPARFRKDFDLLNPEAPPPMTDPGGPKSKDETGNQAGMTVPENCLVRLIDVTVEPGRFYRYRVKIKMANPNYNNPNVASPDYKVKTELVSKDWFELKQSVSVPPELIYYVVDEKRIPKAPDEGATTIGKPTRGTLRYEMWRKEPPEHDRYAVFQFHRWIESTPITPDGEPVPIGEWAVADRVFVARGEYVGQKVKVDLPVWKYTLDMYVLPVEDQRAKKVRTKEGMRVVPTGVTVNFGEDNPNNETILVDFEGGRSFIKAAKVDDASGIEVLMLSPDGKLRARNSAADTNDKARENRRAKVLTRIEEVRKGKAGGGAGPGGGLDGR